MHSRKSVLVLSLPAALRPEGTGVYIEVEKAGLKVELKKPAEFKRAEEFQAKLDEMPDLKTAFEALTPGRQRAYLLHFTAPKLTKTRLSRVEKYIPQILDGKGLE